jgi:Phage integrase, N-terminal SAM-like domain
MAISEPGDPPASFRGEPGSASGKVESIVDARRLLTINTGSSDAGKMTVGEYVGRWIEDSVKDTVRQRTYERYEQIVRVHIKPALERVKLSALTPAHVRSV